MDKLVNMQVPAQGQANPQDPPNPPGESPADEESGKQQEEALLAQAKTIRFLTNLLHFTPLLHTDALNKIIVIGSSSRSMNFVLMTFC